MAVPKIQKVVVNMGLGEATSNAKLVDVGADEIARITGQKPVTRRAKKSIAAFKVRKGMPIAAMVTLRGERMRSEEHTSELQSRGHLVCRLLLEKKKKNITIDTIQ